MGIFSYNGCPSEEAKTKEERSKRVSCRIEKKRRIMFLLPFYLNVEKISHIIIEPDRGDAAPLQLPHQEVFSK